MFLSEGLIEQYIKSSVDIIKEVMPSFVCPNFHSIKITRARSYWAQISNTPYWEDFYDLKVSQVFNQIPDQTKAETRLQSTIVHELLHTIKGCFNHGSKFQNMCYRINRLHPELKLQTGTPAEDVDVTLPIKEPKMTFTCNKCGKVYNWFRKPKYSSDNYCCSCGSSDFEVNVVKQCNSPAALAI